MIGTLTLVAALLAADPCPNTRPMKAGDVAACDGDLVPLDRGRWLLACRTAELPAALTALEDCAKARKEAEDEAAGLRVRLEDARGRPLAPCDPPPAWYAQPAPWLAWRSDRGDRGLTRGAWSRVQSLNRSRRSTQHLCSPQPRRLRPMNTG